MPQTTPVGDDANGWYRSINPRISLAALPTYLLNTGYVAASGHALGITPLIPGLGIEATLGHRGRGLLADVDEGGAVTGVLVRDAGGAVTGMELNGDYLEKQAAWKVLLPLPTVLIALVLLLTVPFGRRKVLRHPWLRGLPSLALLAVVATVLCAMNVKLTLLGQANWQTVGIFAGSLIATVLSLGGLVLSARTWRDEPARLATWRCMLGSAAGVYLSLWLAAFGLLPLMLWSW